METRQCLECHTVFEPKRPTKKYCSDACKQAAYLQRQQEIKPTADHKPIAQNSALTLTLKDYLLQDISAKLSQLLNMEGPHKTIVASPDGAKNQIIILCCSAV